jgi:hypothetical protein
MTQTLTRVPGTLHGSLNVSAAIGLTLVCADVIEARFMATLLLHNES